MLGYSDSELAALGGYDLVHYDDLSYISSAHQEREWSKFIFLQFMRLKCFTFVSFEDRSVGNDRVPVPEEGRRMAVAPNQLKISL